jgi:hypothetical protein
MRFPLEYLHWEPIFQHLFLEEPTGTYFIAIFLQGAFFLETIFNKISFPQVTLEISIRNEIPSRIFPLETLFLTDISRGTCGKHILMRIFCKKKRLSVGIRPIYRFP